MVSYYQVLGVDEDSSQDNIKLAYRERMKAHHTDRHGQSDDPIVRLIAEAYRVLGNTAEREQYNKRLHGNGDSSFAMIKGHQSSADMPPQPARDREVCGRCEGRGYHPTLGVRWPCQYCNGKGWMPGKIAL
jgi:DnaJ-class molecular chaperone